MERIEPPDSHRVRAAVGWLELGCPADALQELDGLSEDNTEHPDVLELRWQIHAAGKDWPAAVGAATRLMARAPERASGWLHHAYALRRAPNGGLERARDALRPAFEQFPREPLIPYNLACYACQLGKLNEARHWFRCAVKAGRKATITRLALKDEDLRPLWDEIRAMD